jgi:hypothetical protein
MAGCAHKSRGVANIERNNMVVIQAGAVENEGYSWMSSYIIDRATKECYTQLSMYSVIKTDCTKLKIVPEAAKVLKEIGI